MTGVDFDHSLDQKPGPPPDSKSIMSVIVGLVSLIFGVAFAMPTALLLFVGLMPTLMTILFNRKPDQYSLISVGVLNFCGVIPYLTILWGGGNDLDTTIDLLSDGYTWLAMYGCAALGALIYIRMPDLTERNMAWRDENRIKRCHLLIEHLKNEWGAELTESRSDQDDPA